MHSESRSEVLENSYFKVFDDLFSQDQILSFYHSLLVANYSCLQSSTFETRKYKEWMANFDSDDFQDHWLYQTCNKLIETLPETSKHSYKCTGTFANLFSFGGYTFPHSDSADTIDPEHNISFLYYANSEWKPEWGGETIFYDNSMDPIYCIGVKPGRLVVFPGDLVHRAGVPDRSCHEHRFSFSIRFSRAS